MMELGVLAAVVAWLWLFIGRGQFWQLGPVLAPAAHESAALVAVVVPARDEAAVIGQSLASLLAQTHRRLRILLVDDQSNDGTAEIARAMADPRLSVLTGQAKPPGWSGKLWAVEQGIGQAGEAAYVLLTDADIVHAPGHVAALVAKAEAEQLDLVSEMVALRCQSWAERALVPAFVFFFQLLYPFAWVNDTDRATAAAAGGTILMRRAALTRIGGIAALRGALIDDVTLAGLVKPGGPIWLGHSVMARSVRAYPAVADIWHMVARTGFVQLRRSWLLLAATILGMAWLFLLPPAAALFARGPVQGMGALVWVIAAGCYVPSLRRFGRSLIWAPLLPLVALFYMAATIGSAVNDARGRGVVWKARAYRGHEA